jgi:hypothetical protein
MDSPTKDVSAGQRIPRTVAIVPHTHWDREWSGRFRDLQFHPGKGV